MTIPENIIPVGAQATINPGHSRVFAGGRTPTPIMILSVDEVQPLITSGAIDLDGRFSGQNANWMEDGDSGTALRHPEFDESEGPLRFPIAYLSDVAEVVRIDIGWLERPPEFKIWVEVAKSIPHIFSEGWVLPLQTMDDEGIKLEANVTGYHCWRLVVQSSPTNRLALWSFRLIGGGVVKRSQQLAGIGADVRVHEVAHGWRIENLRDKGIDIVLR